VLEEIPAGSLRRVAEAAAGTLREVTTRGLQGRAVGVRVLREALLDHVPILMDGIADYLEDPSSEITAEMPVIGKAIERDAKQVGYRGFQGISCCGCRKVGNFTERAVKRTKEKAQRWQANVLCPFNFLLSSLLKRGPPDQHRSTSALFSPPAGHRDSAAVTGAASRPLAKNVQKDISLTLGPA
jgi:hypothetical protein